MCVGKMMATQVGDGRAVWISKSRELGNRSSLKASFPAGVLHSFTGCGRCVVAPAVYPQPILRSPVQLWCTVLIQGNSPLVF